MRTERAFQLAIVGGSERGSTRRVPPADSLSSERRRGSLATGHGPPAIGDLEGRGPLVREQDAVAVGFRDAEEQARDGSQPRGHEIVLEVLAVYAGPVRFGLSGRLAMPFSDASAVFQIPLRMHSHHGCGGRKCGLPQGPPPGPRRAR